jgi:hypothetical protein
MDGWMGLNVGVRVAHSNQKYKIQPIDKQNKNKVFQK